jgi:hypothetical protein
MLDNQGYNDNFCRQIRIILHKYFHFVATEIKKHDLFISAPYLKLLLLLLFHCMSYANNLNRTSLYTYIDEEINGSVMV